MRKLTTLSLCLLLAASVAAAQEAKKPLSPPAKTEAKIGGRNIVIDYNAPSKRNRVIFGELVPYDKVWRTGANAATTLTTEVDVMIGSLHVPAGKYALFTIPGRNGWTLIVNRQHDIWGTKGYDAAKDVGRVQMQVEPAKETVETFTIALQPAGAKKGTLSLQWENTIASVPVVVH